MKTRHQRAYIFVSLMAVIVVVVMLTGAFVKRSQAGLFRGSHFRDGLRAEQAARGGANHLLSVVGQDNAFAGDVEVALNGASYRITFDTSDVHHSVNNLTSLAPSTTLNVHGQPVPPRTADIVVVGRCGLSSRAVRVVLRRGFPSARSVAAVGKVQLAGDVEIDGVKSLIIPQDRTEPDSAPGGILSKYQSTSSTDYAIEWQDTGGDFDIANLSRLESAPPKTGGVPISPDLVAVCQPDQLVESGAADTIPSIDVAGRVEDSSGVPAPLGLRIGGPGHLLGGTVLSADVTQRSATFIDDARYVPDDLKVVGDLVLADGTLYINGDLELDGGIRGLGSVYVKGNVTMRGGNTVLETNQPSGAALMASGDVRLIGIDAASYLQNLASLNPAVQTRLQAAMDGPNGLTDYYNAPASGHNFARNSAFLAGTPFEPALAPPGTESWVSPIPGLNGRHNHSNSEGLLPALIVAVTDPSAVNPEPLKTAKVARALEEMQFHFRHNLFAVPEFVEPGTGNPRYRLDNRYRLEKFRPATNDWQTFSRAEAFADMEANYGNSEEPFSPGDQLVDRSGVLGQYEWDDALIPMKKGGWTHDHIDPWAVAGSPGPYPPAGDVTPLHRARHHTFVHNHPLDFSWLGDSTYQGVVYAGGDISAEQGFKIVGSLLSLGNVSLLNGSKLTFNEQYRDLYGERPPIAIMFFEEL